MRYASLASGIAILVALLVPNGAPASQNEFLSRAAVIEWIDNYRNKPDPSRMPDAVRALSTSGAPASPRPQASTSALSRACSAPIRWRPSA